ncbi:hypothetical protein MO973_02475 [Paenibacillus sp. TRM 82003]|nr:hypothetical protein [Paenibacillus sp. TRM 82003]
MSMPDQLFTWQALAGFGGASLLTFLIVQYTKTMLDRMTGNNVPTDLYAVFVAFWILLFAQLALGADPSDWRVYGLSFANSFLIAAAAGQFHNKALKPPTPRTPPKDKE